MSPSAAKPESGAFGASRSLSLLLLLARVVSSPEFGVGNFEGGGIACDLPVTLRAVLVTERFSLSEENDAAGDGEGESAVGLSSRTRERRVDVLLFWILSS